ncbi:MAG: hypothetical protein Q9169_006066 [Polycauliona sp. 2 TL-2023]
MADEDPDYVLINPADALSSDQDSVHAPQPPHILAKIQKWLCPSEYAAESSDYNKHRRSFCPNTGEWLRQSDRYRQWHNTGESALWINGIPGSGKSVVAASLVSDLHDNEHVPVLYFFFRYANLANRTPKQLVRDWLSQLLDHSTLLQSRLKDLIEESTSHESVTFDDLWTIFRSAAVATSRLYCVADALDEMEPGNDWFLHKLAEMGRRKPSVLKLLLTSRQSPHIEKVYKEPLVSSINLDRRLIDGDIATYVDHLLLDHAATVSLPGQKQLVTSTVQSKANGLFIYARLMMDEIVANATSTNVETLLDGLPSGMDDMYTTLLSEHSRRSGVTSEIQTLILQWITHATRPLRLLEVAELVRSVSQEYGSIQETKSTVRSACGPLLTVLPDETLQVIHHSFTEFLVNTTRTAGYPAFEAEEVHTKAAVTAIDYIVSCSTADEGTGATYERDHTMFVFKSRQRDAFYLKYPLLQYAVNSWMIHASRSRNGDALLIQAMDRFLSVENDHFAFWLGIWHMSGQKKIRDIPQQLHIASFFGLKCYVARACKSEIDVDMRASDGCTPLSYACDGGHEEVVRLLLDHGASPSISNRFGVAPLHYACASNRPDIVRYLMKTGADPLTQTQGADRRSGRIADKINYSLLCNNRARFGASALQHACTKGLIECVQTIFEHLLPEKRQLGPLHWAAGAGKTEIVQLLLQKYDLDPNSLDDNQNNALCLAAQQHSPATVQLLLESGASIDITSSGIDECYRVPGSTGHTRAKTDSNTMTPLHAWAYGCSSSYQVTNMENMTETAKILIEAGCDVNAKDTEGKTPLFYWTASSGPTCSAFIDVLVSHGADAAIEDHFGCTPLHLLKSSSAESHIRSLLDAGGSMDRHRSTDGRTPLMCALDHWQGLKPPDWYEYVAKYGVDPNAQDWAGQTTLHYILATESWTVSDVVSWLQAGADPNVVDGDGRNCLFSLRTYHGQEEDEAQLFKVLVAAGCDINAKDHQGYNIVLDQCSGGCVDEIKRMHQYGVDISAKNHRGQTTLHLLATPKDYNATHAARGRLELIRFFVEHGVDINAQDYSGDTMLHVAFKTPRWTETRHLFDTALTVGADPAIRNYRGRSIMHSAAGTVVNSHRRHKNEQQGLDILLATESALDVGLVDFDGAPPLHLAATRSAARVDRFIRAGASITALDYQGRSVLHYAARAGNSNVLGQIIQIFRENDAIKLRDQKDCNGRTALHDAVRSGSLASVQVLLRSNADPKASDKKGRTPLHTASEIEEEQMMRRLQSSAAFKPAKPKRRSEVVKPNYKSHPGNIVVEDALRPLKSHGGDDDTDNSIDTTQCGTNSLIRDVVRAMIGAGADPCAKDGDGKYALDLAIETNSRDLGHFLSTAVANQEPYHGIVRRTDVGSFPVRMKLLRWNAEYSMTSQVTQALARTQEEATPLLKQAIIDGNEELIEGLLDLGADPLHNDDEGSTALDLAISNGLVSIAATLIATAKAIKTLPSNLVHTAARREECNLAMIEQLIMLGCNVNSTGLITDKSQYGTEENNLNVVHVLAEGRNWWQPVALEYVLGSGADPEAIELEEGRTALQIAIRGHFRRFDQPGFWRKHAITALLDRGAKVNFVDDKGRTPLLEAIEEGTEIVKMLISHGANVNFGSTLPIGPAVLSGNAGVVEAMLEAGADANAMYENPHRTWPAEHVLLHAARLGGREKLANTERIMELLIGAGADVASVSKEGTPLFIRVIRSNGPMAPFLSRAVDMNIRDEDGMTPFLAACVAHYPDEILERMVQAGADILASDNSGKTAMHHAVINATYDGRKEFRMANFLLANQVPVDALDASGQTALHYAFERGQFLSTSIVHYLLDAGADPAIPCPDPSSRTLLHILLPNLAEGGQKFMTPPSETRPIIENFVKAGLDREARDCDGDTPIFGYVAKQPIYEDEYWEEDRHPDLEEQRQDLLPYNIHAKNNAGEGLLHVVAKRSRDVGEMKDTKDMFKLLWDMGLDPEEEDGGQRTPLDVAAACGNTGILDLFAPPK